MSDRQWLQSAAADLVEKYGPDVAIVAADVTAILDGLVARRIARLGFVGPLVSTAVDGTSDALMLALSGATGDRPAFAAESGGPSPTDTWDPDDDE